MNTLFIGGPKDGEREVLPDGPPHFNVFERVAPRHYFPGSDAICFSGYAEVRYDIKRFREDNKTFSVAVFEGVPNAMEMLLNGYRRRPLRKKRR